MTTDLLARIVEYETGGLDEEETIDLFQGLIDSGLAWQLQGFYGRTAMNLITEGVCHLPADAES